MGAVSAVYDDDIQMIDSSVFRVHQHATSVKFIKFTVLAAAEEG